VRYTELLEQRALALGLVAEGDAGRIYARHVLDSLRAARHIEPSDTLAYDLGAGAGFPGMVLAAAIPSCLFVLVEARRRAAAFLEWAVEELDLKNARVAVTPAERIGEPADVATARAFGSLQRSWEVAAPLLRPGGRLVYFGGRRFRRPERVTDPERPAQIAVDSSVENAGPLVIMTRKA
jgi:16S rRNA (guanine527-N7)-methyltransferase